MLAPLKYYILLSRCLHSMRKSKFQNIEPGSGLGQLLFGLRREEVQEYLGVPEIKFKELDEKERDFEIWEYDELGLSLRFGGEEILKLRSVSIISSFYQLNGVSLIGKNIEEISNLLVGKDFRILSHEGSPNQKLIFSKEHSLIIYFDYDIATSLSWDLDELNVEDEELIRESFKRKRKKKKRSKKKYSRESTTKKYAKVKSLQKKLDKDKSEKSEWKMRTYMSIGVSIYTAFWLLMNDGVSIGRTIGILALVISISIILILLE